MKGSRWQRLAPLSGVLFVVLAVASFVIGGETPSSDDSAREVLDWYRDNDGEAIASALVLMYGLVALTWFLGSLRSALRAAEGGTGRLSAVAFAGGIVLVSGAALVAGFQFAAADTVGDVPADVTQTLSVLNSDVWFPFPVGTSLLMLATALVVIRHGALPAALGWIALVIGIVAVTPVGFFAFLAFLVWILPVSVLLFRAAPAAPASTAPASSPGSPS